MIGHRLVVRPERPGDREAIGRIRHDVYARELGQHAENDSGVLTDALDPLVEYLVAQRDDRVVGFVALTPPEAGRYSLEKYLPRTELPGPPGPGTWEIRLLTTIAAERGGRVTVALALAALRWIEARGGRQVIGMGRGPLMAMYARCGLRGTGQLVRAGAVEFEVMACSIEDSRAQYRAQQGWIDAAVAGVDLCLDAVRAVDGGTPVEPPPPTCPPAAPAYHGGAFFTAIGTDLRTLDRRDDVVPADVLDAWFPPSPRVVDAVTEHLPWLARTSPPTHCEGVVRLIADRWGVPTDCVVPGAGSSDLIFRCLPQWVRPGGRVVLLDPTYGEYRHVLEQVIGCTVQGVPLREQDAFAVDLTRDLSPAELTDVDLVVLVNPNSPTGQVVSHAELIAWLDEVPADTRVWVDETYLPYAQSLAQGHASLAAEAVGRENLVVVTSLSKAWALSGMRAAHLIAHPEVAAQVRGLTPPWVLSLPTQLAVIEALGDPEYYTGRWALTHELRAELAAALEALGLRVVPRAVANYLLARLPTGASADRVVAAARKQGVFLRATTGMGPALDGDAWIRTAVRSRQENDRIVAAVRHGLEVR
ncbi:aminotransferase class I/II-fold pyridoxal phosphate-dependent enzyme [Kytococcus sedentarius]|uniref:histidinol-phosphate aminotransferase family protein n=1 Tax=Kytococcus sedentarius TaxID=1276 RepID=UPI0035BC67D5